MRKLGDLVGGVHRVVAADVAEVADVVRLEHFDHAVEVFGLLGLQLVAAGADRARGGRGAEQGDLLAAPARRDRAVLP